MNQGRLLLEQPLGEDQAIVVISLNGSHAVLARSRNPVLLPWATSTRIATTNAVLDLQN
ncbi:MAG: hypothetical protein ACYCW6_15710 [Candidatus Xenobia bacterium]